MKKIVFIVPLLALSLLTSCGTPVKEYEVTATSGLTVTNPIAYSNKDYETTLTVNESNMVLADNPTKVTINGSESTDYTYSLNDLKNEALFSIQKKYINGPINIELDFGYTVTCNDKDVTFTNLMAHKDKNYKTELTCDKNNLLPTNLTKVLIGEVESTNYEYVPDTPNGSKHATFSISSEFVTGPIVIYLAMEHSYEVFSHNENLKIINLVAYTYEDYETELVSVAPNMLPNTLTRIIINGVESKNYEYVADATRHATLSIKKEYITGPIEIELTMDVGHSIYCPNGSGIVVFSNRIVTEGQKYETSLTIKKGQNGVSFPNTKDKIDVKIKNEAVDYFTYTYTSPTEASFSVDAAYVTGDIVITIPFIYDVTCNDKMVEVGTKTVVYGSDYETTLSVGIERKELPSSIKVKVGKGVLGSDAYTYTLNPSKPNEATLNIPTIRINGPISIELVVVSIYEATLKVTTEETVTLKNTTVRTDQDYETEISFDKETYTEIKMPTALTSVKSGGSDVENYEYTPDPNDISKATLKIDKSLIKGDIEITLGFRWSEYIKWWDYCSCNNKKIKATADDIGKEVTVDIIHVIHRVRLIGIDHDDLVDGNGKAHCTFEFSNLITINWLSEHTGICWNNKDGIFSYNFDYRGSTLNYFLNDKNDRNSVINEISDELEAALKHVVKKVGISTNSGVSYIATSLDDATNPCPYFFPLAHDEMVDKGSNVTEGEGSKYQYYKDHSDQKYRVKKDTNGKAKEYWLRSPNTNGNQYAWSVGSEGFVYSMHGNVSANQFAVAPAFCI